MITARRAIVLRRTDCDSEEIGRLLHDRGLRVVYTVYTDSGPELAARIAVQHALDHDAEVVVVPHLSEQEVRQTPVWQWAAWFVDLVTVPGGGS